MSEKIVLLILAWHIQGYFCVFLIDDFSLAFLFEVDFQQTKFTQC